MNGATTNRNNFTTIFYKKLFLKVINFKVGDDISLSRDILFSALLQTKSMLLHSTTYEDLSEKKRKQKTLLPQVGYQVHKAHLVAYVRMIIKFINVDSFLNMPVAERNAEKETLMYKIPQAIAQKLQAFQLSIPNQLCSRIYLCG